MFFALLMVAGIGMCVHAQQSSLETTDEQNNYLVELTGDNCSFEVTDVKPSINGTTVKITVTVCATFSSREEACYVVVVRPDSQLRNILDSQQKSIEFQSHQSGWSYKCKSVDFYCDVHDNTYNQCSNHSFSATCFKK